jgi:hypothetical protein
LTDAVINEAGAENATFCSVTAMTGKNNREKIDRSPGMKNGASVLEGNSSLNLRVVSN